jgi:two-component system, cell cycle sensor histidine kinase and response regulator CckA
MPDMASPHLGADTVLVVDDDHNVRILIGTVLRRQSFHVLEATNGRDALRVAERHAGPIRLIISDINMPEMGGWMLLERLRAWYPSLRLLLISGFEQPLPTTEELAATPTGFLAKPFTPDALLAAVRQLLDRPPAPLVKEQP